MVTNVADINEQEMPEMLDVRLHLLPAGGRYRLPVHGMAAERQLPASLFEFLENVTKQHPD
jgi:cyanophycinase